TGRPPFGEGRPEALAYRVVHGEADLDGIDGRLEAVVRAALAREPEARPGIDEILLALSSDGEGTVAASTVIASTWAGPGTSVLTSAAPVVQPLARGAARRRRRPTLLTAATLLVVA